MMGLLGLLGLHSCKAYWQRVVLYAVLYLLGTVVLPRGGLTGASEKTGAYVYLRCVRVESGLELAAARE